MCLARKQSILCASENGFVVLKNDEVQHFYVKTKCGIFFIHRIQNIDTERECYNILLDQENICCN